MTETAERTISLDAKLSKEYERDRVRRLTSPARPAVSVVSLILESLHESIGQDSGNVVLAQVEDVVRE